MTRKSCAAFFRPRVLTFLSPRPWLQQRRGRGLVQVLPPQLPSDTPVCGPFALLHLNERGCCHVQKLGQLALAPRDGYGLVDKLTDLHGHR